MTTIKVNDLNDVAAVRESEAANVKGGYELENVLISSYSISGHGGGGTASFRGGVRVAAGDVNG
jgi:hypothetical protein